MTKEVDFFMADLLNTVTFQNETSSMELPLFALRSGIKKSVEWNVRGIHIRVTPSYDRGLASIHDKDIWIYCISKLKQALRDKQPVSPVIGFYLSDFLKTTGRSTGGQNYKELAESLARLRGTAITITKNDDNITAIESCNLISHYKLEIPKKKGIPARTIITLPTWLYEQAIEKKGALTISRDYFKIKKPLERRMYEISRKHCGDQTAFQISIEKIYERSGSFSILKRFKQQLKAVVKDNKLPDYKISLCKEERLFYVFNIKAYLFWAINKYIHESEKWEITLEDLYYLFDESNLYKISLENNMPIELFFHEVNHEVNKLVKSDTKYDIQIKNQQLIVIDPDHIKNQSKETKKSGRKNISYSEAVKIGKPKAGEATAFFAVKRVLEMGGYIVDMSQSSKDEYYNNLNNMPKTTLKPIFVNNKILVDESYVEKYRERGEGLEEAQERLVRSLQMQQLEEDEIPSETILDETFDADLFHFLIENEA